MLVVPYQPHVRSVESLFDKHSVARVLLLIYQVSVLQSEDLVNSTGLFGVKFQFTPTLLFHCLSKAGEKMINR